MISNDDQKSSGSEVHEKQNYPDQNFKVVEKLTPSSRPHALNLSDRPSPPPPIFLHSSFRTSSTWLWTRLRSLPKVMAYYEVFHEGLEQIAAHSLTATNYSSWESHHPPQAPYFLEYLPLLKASGGVSGFDASMSFTRFLPRDGLHGELSIEEQTYLNLLVAQAYRGSKIPLLSCTRSIGRMAAIKRHMPVKNILVYRNLFHQWASYSGQHLRGNPYFIETIGKTISNSHQDDFLARLDEVFTLRENVPQDEKSFSVFLLMHLYLYAQAIDSSDLIIDLTALSDDENMRLSVEAELSQLTFSQVDLSDIQNNFDSSVLTVQDRAQFADTIEQFVKIIASTCSTERSAGFVHRLAAEALAEWERYDILTRHSIAWYNGEADRLKRENEQRVQDHAGAEAHSAALASERDSLAAALAETAGARQAAEAAVATLQQERDGIAATLAETAGARQAAEAAIATLQQERDGIAAALAETTNARQAAEAAIAALQQERDSLAAALAETIRAQEAIADRRAHSRWRRPWMRSN
ncbi:hypothetical protein HHL26_03355 [Sphingobium sp. TB-6]|uniref:hypothetical protein n=1 Tax=Sphingobium sp. TB-6 TaxID=2728850 RepID=UPI00146D9540|nr:hypothetical protein [Sphingobium sp. TB-6]NML88108.1 hypothetical protein [Sphingobium sp. TB-6]